MGYTFHRRSEWLPFSAFGMSGPSQDRNAVSELTIHYNGDNQDLDGSDDTFLDEDYARVLAGMNDSYWRNPEREYALGYNFGCAPDGDLWEIRGFDLRCAANGCQKVNVPAIAVQITTRFIKAEATSEQLDAMKNHWIPWLRTQYRQALVVDTHENVNKRCPEDKRSGTPCPGPTIGPLVNRRFFDHPDIGRNGSSEGTTPTTATRAREDRMLRAAKNADNGNAFVVGYGPGSSARAVGNDAKEIALLAAAGLLDVTSEQLVHDWANVGALSEADCRKYVGEF